MSSSTSRRGSHGAVAPQPLRPADLLAVWDEGRGQPTVARALTILGRGVPAADREALADLPVGERDARLLHLRELSFGPVAECLARCPACEAAIEFPVSIRDLLLDGAGDAEAVVEWRGLRLRVRPATSRDQLSLSGLTDPGAMVTALLQRCAAVIDPPSDDVAGAVPAEATECVAAEMSRLDPGADLRFTLSCPSCQASWTSMFDVASYVWREIDAAARRLIADVHALAMAYGWSESEILDLTPARRRAYLELVGSASGGRP